MNKLIADERIIFRTDDSDKTFCYTPSILRYKNRLIVTLDIGGDKGKYYSKEKYSGKPRQMTGVILISDDNGESFEIKDYFPFYHARVFEDNGVIYIIGHNKDIMIKASLDGGETWSETSMLTNGKWYCMAATGVLKYNGYVYVPGEEFVRHEEFKYAWEVAGTAPVLIRAKCGSDLMKPESWIFSETQSFVDFFGYGTSFKYFGIPFLDAARKTSLMINGRDMSPIGWLESNAVKIYDENHVWYDENSLHIFMRTHTGGTGYCAVIKMKEYSDGKIKAEFEKAPSGEEMVFLPMPGGQMKFRVIYDDISKLYWLLSTQATDSMTDIYKLSEDRYNLPNNERNRLQLHFSKNMVDWCFAGMVAIGGGEKQSRHYGDMIIDGDDLLIVSRSGDENASTAHNGNIITMHRVEDFRKLIY